MSDLGQILTERMTKLDRDQSFPDSIPRDAATLILIDRSGPEPMVLLGRRHHNHKFMPGKFVFPGGRIEHSDADMVSASELSAAASAKLTIRPRDNQVPIARAFPHAAIRETFEETGLLLGIQRDVPPAVPGEAWQGFAAARVFPDLATIHFVARAITPPRRPKRFDTRFFTTDAQAIAGRVEGVIGPDSELVELAWIPIRDATRLDMPVVTGVVLEELGARVHSGMGHDLPVPFYYMEGQEFHRELL
jgi:8-oxo-dGTP pyrophosphatase MutT (NUDIX family)